MLYFYTPGSTVGLTCKCGIALWHDCYGVLTIRIVQLHHNLMGLLFYMWSVIDQDMQGKAVVPIEDMEKLQINLPLVLAPSLMTMPTWNPSWMLDLKGNSFDIDYNSYFVDKETGVHRWDVSWVRTQSYLINYPGLDTSYLDFHYT